MIQPVSSFRQLSHTLGKRNPHHHITVVWHIVLQSGSGHSQCRGIRADTLTRLGRMYSGNRLKSLHSRGESDKEGRDGMT